MSSRCCTPAPNAGPPALLTPGEAPLAALAAAGSDAPLLVVDQFEEVFGPAVDEDERAAFIRALCALATPVVIALRADFYGRALEYPELARAAQEAQVVVGPMDDTDLRSAVVEPARKAGVTIEDGLVEVLLADVHRPGSESGAAGLLPLLSHALLATWRRGEGVRMTVADYHAVGGIVGGVAQSAEEAFTQLPADRQELVRRIFLRLVHVAPDLADTRRRVERAELPGGGEVTARSLDLFVARRLLTVDEHAVEITHEALLTAWPRLRSWIDADRAGLAAHRRLTEAARAWRDAGRDPDLLLRGGRLAAAQELTTQATGELNDVERAFLDAATARDDAERHAERRRTRRLRRLLAVLAVALLVAAVTGAYAVQQRGDMARERDLAVSRQVAARSDVLRAKDPSVAAQLAVAAYRIAPTAEARASLLDATGSPTPARLPGPPGTTQSVAGNAARGLLVTSAGNGPTAQVWARSDRGWQRLADTPPVGDGAVLTVALTPDGRLLAAGAGSAVHLFDLTDPARPAPTGARIGTQGTVTGVAFTPDGRTLVAGGADRTVRSWDVADPARPVPGAVFTGAAAELQAVAVGPDGRLLAAGGADGTTYLWSFGDPARPQPLTGQTGKVHAVAFSPDGGTLAAGSADRTVRLWNVAYPARPPLGEPLTGPTTWVNTVAFSPDGRRLAFGSSDNGLRVVDLPSRRLVALLPHPGPVTAATFLDDATLVSGEADGVARVWPVPGPGMGGFADSVFALDWSADGRVLAVGPGSADGTVSLWRVDGTSATPLGPPIPNPAGEPAFSGSATLTPDGATLAVGRTDGSVRIWDVSTPERPVAVEPPLTGSTGLVEQLTTSPDGATLAVSSDDGTVRLWDLRQPTAPRPLRTLTGPANYVFAAAFSPDGRILAGASADRRGYLWDLGRPGDAPTAVLDGATSYAYSPAFSPDGATLAIGSADKTVRLWDVRRPDLPVPLGAPLHGPTNYVYTVAFGPDGKQLAAASTDGTAWLWDVSTPSAPRDPISLVASADPLFTVAFSPDGATLAAGGADRRVHLWTIDPQRAAAALCARAGAPLSPDEWRRHVGDVPYEPPCPGP